MIITESSRTETYTQETSSEQPAQVGIGLGGNASIKDINKTNLLLLTKSPISFSLLFSSTLIAIF